LSKVNYFKAIEGEGESYYYNKFKVCECDIKICMGSQLLYMLIELISLTFVLVCEWILDSFKDLYLFGESCYLYSKDTCFALLQSC
jgi:hypothetical protein